MAKRTGLGRGIGALIPTAEPSESRPVDVFFPEGNNGTKSDSPSASAPADDALVSVPGARLVHIDPK
ncbi:chromosome partitioning protein ParB, partial [Microbacterium sp. SUBG005]